ncbi:hypothetical protein CDAR_476321 [Caerostris darwini]|uniref:Uncharacterized protein n=1 Tax=Caerostris darwini TaxID=1538125 RepID=A0AAV4TNR7_9ARAC|nr:hypothetical protein CDAR_476321 [Caerostris darwini]
MKRGTLKIHPGTVITLWIAFAKDPRLTSTFKLFLHRRQIKRGGAEGSISHNAWRLIRFHSLVLLSSLNLPPSPSSSRSSGARSTAGGLTRSGASLNGIQMGRMQPRVVGTKPRCK